jgi:hypothetical protein
MQKPSVFTKERMVYWPGEFAEVVDLLNGRDQEGRIVSYPLYSMNTGPIILAASLGVREQRSRDMRTDNRKEISTATFHSNGLEMYLFLVPLLANPSLGSDFLRPENEEQVIREFERYVAGGLEFLAGEMEASAGKAVDLLVQALMIKRPKKLVSLQMTPSLL